MEEYLKYFPLTGWDITIQTEGVTVVQIMAKIT